MMPCSRKMQCRAEPALPPVCGEVREGICPSELPTGINKISQNTATILGDSGKSRKQKQLRELGLSSLEKRRLEGTLSLSTSP